MSAIEFDFGIASDSAYDPDGHLELGIDHYGSTEGAGGAKAANCTPFGFISRPLDPEATADGTPTTGCGILWWREGDHLNAMPLEDPRVVSKIPKVRKGGSMMFCAEGSFALFDGEDPAKVDRAGSFTLGVKYPGKSHVLSMGVRKNGKEEVSLKHGSGAGLAMTAEGKKSALLRNASGNAYFETNDDGNVINGKTKVQGGMVVGQPAAAQPVALALPLIAVLGELITIVSGIVGTTGTGAPAAGLAAKLITLKAQMLSAV